MTFDPYSVGKRCSSNACAGSLLLRERRPPIYCWPPPTQTTFLDAVENPSRPNRRQPSTPVPAEAHAMLLQGREDPSRQGVPLDPLQLVRQTANLEGRRSSTRGPRPRTSARHRQRAGCAVEAGLLWRSRQAWLWEPVGPARHTRTRPETWTGKSIGTEKTLVQSDTNTCHASSKLGGSWSHLGSSRETFLRGLPPTPALLDCRLAYDALGRGSAGTVLSSDGPRRQTLPPGRGEFWSPIAPPARGRT